MIWKCHSVHTNTRPILANWKAASIASLWKQFVRLGYHTGFPCQMEFVFYWNSYEIMMMIELQIAFWYIEKVLPRTFTNILFSPWKQRMVLLVAFYKKKKLWWKRSVLLMEKVITEIFKYKLVTKTRIFLSDLIGYSAFCITST